MPLLSFGQEPDKKQVKTGFGDGLNFSFGEDQYQFKISGFLQPSYQYSKADQIKAENTSRSKRSYLNFSGKALKEKVIFFIQADFSAVTPLLDGWGAYHFTQDWTVSVGQRRTFTNNREMTFDEDNLQFTDRGMLSTALSGNGREFGLFLQGKIGKTFLLIPQFAITSGDGPNSFGANSTDVDLCGFKYGGRLDIFPWANFQKATGDLPPTSNTKPSRKFCWGQRQV